MPFGNITIQDTETQLVNDRIYERKAYNRQNVYIMNGQITGTGANIELFLGNNNYVGAAGAVVGRIGVGDATTVAAATSFQYSYVFMNLTDNLILCGNGQYAAKNVNGTVTAVATPQTQLVGTDATPNVSAPVLGIDNTNKAITISLNAVAGKLIAYQIVLEVVAVSNPMLIAGVI